MCVDLVEKIEARRETALGLPIVARPVVDVVIIDSLLLCVFIIVAKSSGLWPFVDLQFILFCTL